MFIIKFKDGTEDIVDSILPLGCYHRVHYFNERNLYKRVYVKRIDKIVRVFE